MKTTPLSLLNVYYAIGVCLALFGPISYSGINGAALAGFMVIFLILISIGFYWAALGARPVLFAASDTSDQRPIPVYFKVALLVSLAFSLILCLTTVARSGLSAFSLSAGAENYADQYAKYERNSGEFQPQWILSEFVYPFHVAMISWTVFMYRRMSWRFKLLSAAACALVVVSMGLMAGKQKIIGDLMIISTFVFLAAQYGRKLCLRQVIIAAGLVLLVSIVVLGTISYRYELAGISIDNINQKVSVNLEFNEDSSLIRLFGPGTGFALIQLSQYISNGYYGLSLAFSLPFQWTGFIGNSYSLMVVYNRFFGGEFLLERTYPFRAGEEFDWGLSKWHTAFAWFASDLTFPGTLIFFGIVAFVYGRLWRAVAIDRNDLAVPLYAYMSIGFVFVPANNQLMISPGGILALVVFILLWRSSHGQKSTDQNHASPYSPTQR